MFNKRNQYGQGPRGDQARPVLGSIVDEIVASGKPVMIAKRAGKAAWFIGYEEFVTLKAVTDGKVKALLRKALQEIRKNVRTQDLDPDLVEVAIQAARGLN